MLLNCDGAEDSCSPLDSKEIQSVHSKGDQSWVFNGRTDVKAESPILWPPDANRKRSMSRLYIVTCLFNLYAEYIMRNAGLEEEQTGIKISGRNINNFRYAADTTIMSESEEVLKNLLMKVKGQNEKAGLNLNIQIANIMASGPITSW